MLSRSSTYYASNVLCTIFTPAENILWLSKTIFSFIRTFSITPSAFSTLRLRKKISSLSLRWILYTESEQFPIVILILCESSELSVSRISFLLSLLRFLDWALVIISVFGASLSETRNGNSRDYCISGISILYMISEEGFFTN
jgi:hypothetical protein